MTLELDTKLFSEQIKAMVLDAISTVQSTPDITQRLISKRELAQALDISVSMVDGLRRQRIIHGYKIGKGEKVPVRFDLNETIADIKKLNSLKGN